MPRLFLLDGTALAFRAHYAMMRSGLTAPDGRPTGAIFGFAMTLKRLLQDEQPDAVAVAFDAKGPTFRHERYKEYKATREKAPEEMVAQLEDMRELVHAQGMPLYEIPGWEADDVIGTLAVEAAAAGWEVRIVTGDKDLMQLVSDQIVLHNVFKQGVDLVLQGVEAVEEKFGCKPAQVIDVLAIMGDSSDNVPGVKGIGEKGAIKLIQEFGSVPALLERIEEVKGKTKEKLENDRENLLLSRELVTIDTSVPLDPPVSALGAPQPDPEALVRLYTRLDFKSLADELQAPQEAEEREYVIVRDAAQLDAMLGELRAAGAFAVDTETTSLFPLQAELVGVSLSAAPQKAYYVPFNLDPPVLEGGKQALLEALTPLLTDPELRRVGQNTKYDWLVFHGQGLELPPPDFDTMVASFCVAGAGRRHNLDSLALHYFGMQKIPTSQLIGTGAKQITMDMVDVDTVGEYACEDADVTWRLYGKLAAEVEEAGAQALFHDLELPLVPVLAEMEKNGVRLDVPHVESLSGVLEKDAMEAAEAVQELADRRFNVASTKVLGEVLFEQLCLQDKYGVKRPKRTKTGWATDAATLSEKYGEEPIVQKILEYRELAKLKGTYVDALPRYVNPQTGRIHCSFSQVAAATGRLASSDPNLQNIPVRTERGRELRKAFLPAAPDERGEWVLLAADYSQIELRVMAHLSGDAKMCAAFESGADVHAATAAEIFGVDPDEVSREQRSQAKVINFGLLYGMGARRLGRETGLSLSEAEAFIERYFASFPTVRGWIDATLDHARQHGSVETLLGRRREVPDINSGNSRVRSFAENAAVNTPVQGSAADIIKRAMIDVHRELGQSELAARMLLQVHDELLFECPTSELDATRALVTSCMENAVQLDVPLVVDCGVGANWLEAH